MKQMLEENELAEEDPTAKRSSIIDKEIEERLAKLKGINPSECAVTVISGRLPAGNLLILH